MAVTPLNGFNEVANEIMQMLWEKYYYQMWATLDNEPKLIETFPTFLLNPTKLIFYFGKTHFAIEYIGIDGKKTLESPINVELKCVDYTESESLLDDIVGVEYSDSNMCIEISGLCENLYVPSNEAFEILEQNKWNYSAQSMIFNINPTKFRFAEGKRARLVNSFFYSVDSKGLLVRNIKWLDVFPMQFVDVNDTVEEIQFGLWPDLEEKALADAHYVYPKPKQFKYEKLVTLNRFIELFSTSGVSETEITRFLAKNENQFILKMAFFAISAYYAFSEPRVQFYKTTDTQ